MSIRVLLADEHSVTLQELQVLIERESDIQVVTGLVKQGDAL